jgi:hypothetical protein
MLSEADDYIEEREGGKLVIFRRSGIFQARIYRGKGSRGYIYRSLNTRDLEQARKARNGRAIGRTAPFRTASLTGPPAQHP